MKKLHFTLLSILLLLAGACTYYESDTYVAEPVPGTPPSFSVTTNLDTLVDPRVSDSMEVIYDIELENGLLYQAEAYLQDLFLFGSDSLHGSFYITTGDVESPGVDTLRLWFLFNTNSNSLADIIGVEYNIVNLNYGILFEGGGL